ncbi:MAG: hypothetical protein ABI128_01900 [Rhodanobacter sp.]
MFDTDAGHPVMRFNDPRGADPLAAKLQVQELHAELERWSPIQYPR